MDYMGLFYRGVGISAGFERDATEEDFESFSRETDLLESGS